MSSTLLYLNKLNAYFYTHSLSKCFKQVLRKFFIIIDVLMANVLWDCLGINVTRYNWLEQEISSVNSIAIRSSTFLSIPGITSHPVFRHVICFIIKTEMNKNTAGSNCTVITETYTGFGKVNIWKSFIVFAKAKRIHAYFTINFLSCSCSFTPATSLLQCARDSTKIINSLENTYNKIERNYFFRKKV